MLGRFVQRASVKHGGRAVKWLGDGVMLHFPNPGSGVMSALEMVAGVADAGLPPAHVGLHAGPVIFQEGDYYGQTVNLASRIADYAQAGEVIVSQEVVDASIGFAGRVPGRRPGRAQGRIGRAAPVCRCPRMSEPAVVSLGPTERDRRRADARGHQDDRRQGRVDRR